MCAVQEWLPFESKRLYIFCCEDFGHNREAQGGCFNESTGFYECFDFHVDEDRHQV